jgi:tyrosine-protein phosphatase YwqE
MMVASIGHGRVIDRLVPVDLTATACTSDLVGARMDTVSDAVLERSIEERIASDARSAGIRATARSALQVDRTAAAEREGQNRKDQ